MNIFLGVTSGALVGLAIVIVYMLGIKVVLEEIRDAVRAKQ
jgi:hypothetical protein